MTDIIIKLFILLILIYLSVVDIRTMTVPLKGVAVIFAVAVLCIFFGKENIYFYIKGWLLITVIVLILAAVTGGIGGGDVKLFSSLGAAMGAGEALKILILSFFLSGIFAIAVKVMPVKISVFISLKNKKEIPFVPFIAFSAFLIFTENLLYYL